MALSVRENSAQTGAQTSLCIINTQRQRSSFQRKENATGFHFDMVRHRMFSRWLSSLATAVVVMTLSAADVSSAKKQNAHDKFYEHAIELIAQGDYKGAIIELKNALQADPKDIAARVLLGNTYLEIEDGASAAKEFLRSRKDGARDSFVLAPLGRAYVLQGRFRQALKELSTAGQNQSTAAEIAVIRGDAHLALQDFAAAEKNYLEASKIRPKDTKSLNGLARVKIAINDLVGAKNYVQWALKIRQDDPQIWFTRGEISRNERKDQEALSHYSKAIELAPRFVRPRLARARILIDRGEHNEAEPDIASVRAIDIQNPHGAFLHSLILARQGKVKEARDALIEAENILKTFSADTIQSHAPTKLLLGVVAYFRKDYVTAERHLTGYLKRVPQHLGARKLVASLALSNGDTKYALHLLEYLVRRVPKDVDVLTMYGDALMRAKQFKKATKVLEQAAAVAQPGSSALSRLVMLRVTAGQNEEAKELLKAEIARDPQAVRAALLMAATQLNQREYVEALETANSVLAKRPNNPVAHNLAGGAHFGMKDIDAARRSFRAAFEAVPNYVLAISNLAKLEYRLGRLGEAEDLYADIVERDPRNGTAMLALSEIDMRRNDLDGALRWLEKAANQSRVPRVAALRLVDLYVYAGKTDRALSMARKLNGTDPSNLIYLMALGRTRLIAKRVEQAALTFKNIADRAHDKKSANWLVKSAVWQLRALDKEGARDSLRKALAIDGKYLPAHLEYFKMEMASDQHEAAIARARNIISLDRKSPIGDMLLGDVFMRVQKFGPALGAYAVALKKNQGFVQAARVYRARRAAGRGALEFVLDWAGGRSDDKDAQRLLARAYADYGQDAKAEVIYARLLEASPKDTLLLNNLALLYQRRNDSRGLDYAERAYEAAPSEPAVMDTYGWILVQRDQVDEGLALLRNARLRAPGVPEIRYHIAVALNKLGQTKEARQELQAALRSGQFFEGITEVRKLLGRSTATQQ